MTTTTAADPKQLDDLKAVQTAARAKLDGERKASSDLSTQIRDAELHLDGESDAAVESNEGVKAYERVEAAAAALQTLKNRKTAQLRIVKAAERKLEAANKAVLAADREAEIQRIEAVDHQMMVVISKIQNLSTEFWKNYHELNRLADAQLGQWSDARLAAQGYTQDKLAEWIGYEFARGDTPFLGGGQDRGRILRFPRPMLESLSYIGQPGKMQTLVERWAEKMAWHSDQLRGIRRYDGKDPAEAKQIAEDRQWYSRGETPPRLRGVPIGTPRPGDDWPSDDQIPKTKVKPHTDPDADAQPEAAPELEDWEKPTLEAEATAPAAPNADGSGADHHFTVCDKATGEEKLLKSSVPDRPMTEAEREAYEAAREANLAKAPKITAAEAQAFAQAHRPPRKYQGR